MPLRSPSLAVSVSTYVPAVEKIAVLEKPLGVPNVTVPGPLALLQIADTGAPLLPSSVTAPVSNALSPGA